MGKSSKRKQAKRGFGKIHKKKPSVTKVIPQNIGFGEMKVEDLIALLEQCDPDATISVHCDGMEGDGTIQCVQEHWSNPQSDGMGGYYRSCEVTLHDWEPDWEEDFGEEGILTISRNGLFVKTQDHPLDEVKVAKAYDRIMKMSEELFNL